MKDRVRRALEKLARDVSNPSRIPGKAVKRISGTRDTFHRLRVGNYRAMYDVLNDDRVVLVLGIVHRGELERWLRQR